MSQHLAKYKMMETFSLYHTEGQDIKSEAAIFLNFLNQDQENVLIFEMIFFICNMFANVSL